MHTNSARRVHIAARTHNCCKDKAIIKAPHNHIYSPRGWKQALSWTISSRRQRWHRRRWDTQMICFLPASHFYLPNMANFLLLAIYMTFLSKSFRMRNNSLRSYNQLQLKVSKHSYFSSTSYSILVLHSLLK